MINIFTVSKKAAIILQVMGINKTILTILFFSASFVCSQQIELPEIIYNYINTFPQNAAVYLNGNYVGSSPCRFTNNIVDSLNKNEIVIKLNGYHDFNFEFELTDLPLNKYFSLISKNNSFSDIQVVQKNRLKLFNTQRSLVPVTISGVLTVGSAILSFYFKRLANERYDEYLFTGDPNTLSKTRKFDLYSGIGLGAFEVSFVSLLYFLLIK
jgi:hypothetical protein